MTTTVVVLWQGKMAKTKKGENAMHAQTAKLVARIAENLPAMTEDVMQGWIENPKGLQKVLEMALCPPQATPELKVWKTIKLGTGLKSAKDFLRVFRKGFGVGAWAEDIMSQPAFSQSLVGADPDKEYDLVLLTTSQLTGKPGGTTVEVFAGAARLGLEKCPAWMGPKLRQEYSDQPDGEVLLIGMEPISHSGVCPGVFRVEHFGLELWLDGYYGSPGSFWDAGFLWVFIRPRK